MRCQIILVAAVILAGFTGRADATAIPVGLDHVISGAPPSGLTPWLSAKFDDYGATGSVTLTLSGANLTGTESVKGWYFNFDPSLTSQIGNLEYAISVVEGSFELPSLSIGADAKKADGDGYYDILVEFSTDELVRFGTGDTCQIVFSGISAMDADSFGYLSSGSKANYYSAAHVTAIAPVDGDTSGWIVCTRVPEPSTFVLTVLLFVAGLGIAFRHHCFAGNR